MKMFLPHHVLLLDILFPRLGRQGQALVVCFLPSKATGYVGLMPHLGEGRKSRALAPISFRQMDLANILV